MSCFNDTKSTLVSYLLLSKIGSSAAPDKTVQCKVVRQPSFVYGGGCGFWLDTAYEHCQIMFMHVLMALWHLAAADIQTNQIRAAWLANIHVFWTHSDLAK